MAKFKLGDKVKVGDQKGTVVEVGVHDKKWLEECGQLYGVRLEPWPKVTKEYLSVDGDVITKTFYENPVTKERRDHEADTLGGVQESTIKLA